MKLVRFLPHALIIAVLCSILMAVSQIGNMGNYLVTWAVFQTWALYFVAGANPKAGFKAIVCYILGLVASIGIFKAVGPVTQMLGGNSQLALTIVASTTAFLIILLEKIPAINYIPGYFIGAGSYFALSATKWSTKHMLGALAIAVVVGAILGWLTVTLRTKYAKISEKPAPAPEEVKK